MRVGSDTPIYSPLAKQRSAPSIAGELASDLPGGNIAKPAVRSDQQLLADFHARMAKQSLDWADTNADKKVTKAEFMDGKARLSAIDKRPNDTAANEKQWAVFDPSGKGWVSEDDIRGGQEKLFPVSVGHLGVDYAQRLAQRRS